ncbi:unnamed protein product [Dovyalis caffra]|uniref:Pectin acetylesterase n=1 Tax=Dovyalis caffra TaxID=77055 RepID=A0AAV1SWL5_9ROSI|nr:unnamed protein product [Dovyalis caffra]
MSVGSPCVLCSAKQRRKMLDSRLGQWLKLLVSLLLLLKTQGVYVGITYVKNAVAKGAVCLDGSPPAYHWDKGFGTGINSWLINFEGGGWCNNVTTCLSRKKTHLGSSKLMGQKIAFSGIMNNKRQFNPDFYNWNRVKIRYCDGSSFTGDVQAVNPATNLHFRGARIWLAVMEDLLAKGLKNAENALLSGCSAGGLASILHCDSFHALLRMGTKVKCLSDAGYFINVKDVSGAPHVQSYFNQIVTLHGSAKNLPLSCTSRLKPSLCFFPQYVAPQVRTPLFILNAAYDSWQIKNILAPSIADPRGAWNSCKLDINNCSPLQLKAMQDFRLQFLNALNRATNSSSRGLYIDSCYAHCQTETQATWFTADSPVLAKMKIAKAVGDWFYDRNPFQKIDCPYPCNPTCQNNGLAPPNNPEKRPPNGSAASVNMSLLLCGLLMLIGVMLEMTDSRLRQRLSVIVCLLILLKTGGVSVEITYVNSAVAKGAVCLDGSPPAYHFDKGFGEGINNWLIQIEVSPSVSPTLLEPQESSARYFVSVFLAMDSQEGAWCKDIKSCLSRKNTASGSSKKMKKQMGFSGILSRQQKSNPDFYNWNRIKVRYCDGSSFTGNVEVVDPVTNLHFRGARVWLAVIEDLLAKGMKNAQNNAKVKCISDAGFFIHEKDVSGQQRIETFYNEVVATHTIAKAVGDWFYERRNVHMIDCVCPCNPTCHKIVSDSLLDEEEDEDEEQEVEID